MRFIDLVNNNRSAGRFDVPQHMTSDRREIFKLQSVTLSGSNGVVFRATQMRGYRDEGPLCAVKLLRQVNPARIDRFHNEIRVLRELDSPHISKYLDSGSVEVTSQQDPGVKQMVPWVAMQLGSTNLRQHIETNGPLDLARIKNIFPAICAAAGHLHERGFIHRDIKPENFVWRDEARSAPMMIDFGLAKRSGEDVSGRPMDTFTQVTEFVGPVFFSSPELIQYARNKAHPVDYRPDIFQLGKVLWYLSTGKISAGIPARRDCPAQGRLRDLVAHMIDDDVDSRPQTLAEVSALPDQI